MIERSKPLAAIDIGTNSIHLVIVSVNYANGRFKILDREKEIVRLGSGPSDMKSLSRSAMKRGVETLRRFKRIADATNTSVRAVATSAVREALNREDFIQQVRSETEINIEIISGAEEARLIYLGILQALPVFDKKILMVDIGGGSTEFLVGKKQKIYYDNSLKLGAIRLSERFFPGGITNAGSIKKCREYIKGTLSPVFRAVNEVAFETVVGSSGTIENIARMIQSEKNEELPPSINASTFTGDELYELVDRIVSAQDNKQRSKIKGLDQSRVDIITAGVLILEQIFEELDIEQMAVSEFALREGIIYDTVEKAQRKENVHNLHDIRYGSVIHLAESLMYEKKHSHHVAKLALSIFDQISRLHRLGEREREYLEAAALLHEIGLFLSHDQHHRHSYYLIRNAELLGFTEDEKEIIANIARYHRKSHPKEKHEGFRNLQENQQFIVMKLAAILRIADGLDRTHTSRITALQCRKYKKSWTFKLKRSDGKPVDIELWGANRKKNLFEEIFNRKLAFKLI